MSSSLLRNAIVLGLLTAMGPFAIDMYLPALPAIGVSLSADTGMVQASLMAFFISLGAGQLIYGPLSDMLGRKLPLYFGLAVFLAGSIGCAFAPDIETLIAFRFLQGLGACAGMVIPRAVVRDLHTGTEAARLMSLLMLVFSVSPILAPLAGSFVIEAVGWRGVFWVVTVLSALGILLMALFLGETRPREHRVDSSIGGALSAYRALLTDWKFLGLTFIGAFGISSFFAYLANSSFVLIEHYGLSPRLYAVFFSINAVSFIGVSQTTGWLASRFGLNRIVRIAVTGYAVAMALLLVVTLAGVDRLDVLATLLFIGYGFLGLVIPTTAVLSMEEHGAIAGTASALMGTLQFVTGALVIAVVGPFFDGTSLPMVVGIAGCAIISFILAQVTLGRRRPVEVPAE
jgi:DHA1 family bicyclomycin/chloramphenicol resistance-like MFS transporter